MEWYQWYWSKYESDTLHLNLEQDAIYRRLIDWYISRQSPIPDNDQAIATICRISVDKWLEHSEVISKFLKSKNGKLHLKLCDLIISDQERRFQERREKAKNAAKVRWEKNDNNQQDKCYEHATSNANAMLNDATDQQTNKQTDTKDLKTNSGLNGFGSNHENEIGGSGWLRPESNFVPTLETAQKLMDIAYGWDQHSLVEKYNQWHNGKERPHNPQAAFIGWAKKFTAGKMPS